MKERKKLKQQDEPASKEDTPAPNEAPAEATEEEPTTKKGKKEKAKKEEEKKGKKPGNKKLLAMQEALKEAEELRQKAIREAEEQLRKEEEAEREKYVQILFIFIEFEIYFLLNCKSRIFVD